MKTYTCAAILSCGCLVSGEQLTIGPEPSNSLHLYVEKTGLLSGKLHHFTFDDYAGTLTLQPASVTLTIQSGSIVCRDTWVGQKDLKKVTKAAVDDMLAVRDFPRMEFHSTTVRQSGQGQFEVTGSLTIRDKTKPVAVAVKQTSTDQPRFEGKATVKLTDFGLKPPSTALGLVGTKDEMTFVFSLAARSK